MLTEGFYFYFIFFYELSMVVIVVFCGACVSWFLISFILYLMAFFFFPMSQLLLGICKTVHILSSWTRKLLFKGCLAKNLVGQLTHFGIFDGDV